MGHGKVLILGINYAPEMIGVAPYTTGMAAGLAARGYDVQVLTGVPHYPYWNRGGAGGGFHTDEVLDGVRVRRFNHLVPQKFSWFSRALMEIVFGVRVALARWGSPDVVICITPPLLAAALAAVRVRLTRRRPALGILVQDIYSRGVAETNATSGLFAGAIRLIESATLKMCDGVSTIHPGFSADLSVNLGVKADRLREIRNWTHVDAPEQSASLAFRKERGWTGEEIVVLHAGNMGYKQGLENVVAAAAMADRNHSPVRFVLVGDGNQRPELEDRSAGIRAVEFIDAVGEAEFPAVLGAADVLLVNERPGVAHMSFPSKLTSYFKSGRPVLAAVDGEGYAAVEIGRAGAGVCVPPGRPDLLLQEAELLGKDTHRSAGLGAAGRHYSEVTLSRESSIDSYQDWVNWLADKRGHPRSPRG